MASEYPILMLPDPAEQVKAKRSGRGPAIHRPDIKTQGGRLKPKLDRLVKAMDQQRIKVQVTPDGLEPEYALVFEAAGSLDSFYGAVKKLEGLEWMFDFDSPDFGQVIQFEDDIKKIADDPDNPIAVEIHHTPHGFAVITSRGFDTRPLYKIWDPSLVGLKRDDLLCCNWITKTKETITGSDS